MTLNYDAEWHKSAAPLLELGAKLPKPVVHDVAAKRAQVEQIFASRRDTLPDSPNVEVIEHKIKSFDGAEIVVFQLKPKDATGPLPAYAYFHGGGMIALTARELVKITAINAQNSGAQFFSVEYRLAPEARSPTQTEDCYAGLAWLSENATSLGVEPHRIGVFGESAGGGLAAGVALMARDRGLQPPLARQILIYPMLDYRNTTKTPAIDDYLSWTVNDNITGWTAYLGEEAMKSDKISPYASPAHAEHLKGLPSTYIDTGGFDLFRDEDIAYAARLTLAEVEVEFHLYPGVPHGFEGLAPTSSVVRKALANRLDAMRKL